MDPDFSDSDDEAEEPNLKTILKAIKVGNNSTNLLVSNLNSSVQTFNENLNARCDGIDASIAQLKDEIRDLKQSHGEELELLKERCDELDYKTKTEIFIHGYENASAPDLDLASAVIHLAEFLDLSISDRDIQSARIIKRRHSPNRTYASSAAEKRPPIIAVNFFSHTVAAKLVDAKKRHGKLMNKDLAQTQNQGPIAISFPLDKEKYALLRLTKARALQHDIKCVWNSRGMVFTRQREGAPAIKIRNEAHLNTILPPLPPTCSQAEMETDEPHAQ